MNFSQLQERLRVELLRRIERGAVSVSLLARQTGLGQGHVSNFLHGRRGLSLGTLDKMLAAQRLTVADLLPERREAKSSLLSGQIGEAGLVPLVSADAAISEPYLRPRVVQTMLPFPAERLTGLLVRCPPARRQWERFVAVRIGAEEARVMEPVLAVDCVVVLDRHYTSFRDYVEGKSNLYGARGLGSARLVIRYAQSEAGRVVLRPHGIGFPLEVMDVAGGETPNDLLVGRVVLVLNAY
jgi:transcriptional regulator with XRE-family HTH domain